MSALVATMIADLRRFSGQLLEPGIETARGRLRASREAGGDGVLLESARAMTAVLPHLLSELEDLDDPRNTVERRTWTARRARLSRSPRDWARSGPALVPQRWLRTEPAPQPDLRALGWLLYLVGKLEQELELTAGRVRRHVEEARTVRSGSSAWARDDRVRLEALLVRVDSVRSALLRARQGIARRSAQRARPSPHAPSPYPRGHAWWRVRQLAADVGDRRRTLQERIAALLEVEPQIADAPVLYQRWCGMRLVEGLVESGWRAEGDCVGALFLAGRVSFLREGTRIDLWIETRIPRAPHPSGFVCVRGDDVTPDFVIVTPGAGGVDAFVLDATLSTDEQVVADKRRYLELLQGVAPAMVAGVVSGPRRPLRAWAAAPYELGHCRLLAQHGSCGVIPMHPAAWNPAPLRAWLKDVERHARAWSDPG